MERRFIIRLHPSLYNTISLTPLTPKIIFDL